LELKDISQNQFELQHFIQSKQLLFRYNTSSTTKYFTHRRDIV